MHRLPLRRRAIRVYDRLLGPHEVPRPARRIFRSLGAGALAVDCGANVGNVTARLAERGAEVYAFEPNPFAFAELEHRFGANPRVHCLPQAVAASTGRSGLHLHRDAHGDELRWSVGSSLLAGKPNVDAGRTVEVETIDLDTFLGGLDRPVHVLKLDVEGTEVEILERLLETGRLGQVDHVLVEMHDRRIPALAERGEALRRRLAAPEYGHVRLDWT